MNQLEIVQMIHTTLLRRGSGRDESDPVRLIDQWYDMNGNLRFEYDPMEEKATHYYPPPA